MTTDESDLGANWGQGLQIDESILPGFDISLSIKALKEVCQYGNRYARTVAGVVGYRQTQGNIFHGFISDTTATKWVETPTPYSVCGLGDLGQLVALNKMFQSLQERFQPKQTNLKADELKFKQGNSNMGAQFAPEDLGNAHPKISDPTHSFPNPAFDRVREIIDKDVREVERNELIAEVNSTSFEANLRKCAVTNPDNPLDSVISVLSVISADPHTLVNQLKIEADGGNQICTLVMGLLTSHKSRDAIANGIKTEEDAQELAEACTNFLNKTWLDSPTMRPFDAGIGDQKHVLTYNQERLRALAVSVTAMAEVLTMLGQVDGIDPSAKEAAQKALENILDRLNEEVLFKNVKNETPEAAAARKQIAQLKLYIASQQSKLVGGSQHLSAKWSANVIASLAECGDKTSGSLEFLDNLIGAELSRFRSEFAIGFSKHAAEDNGFFIQHTGSAAMDIIKHSHQPPETASASLAADQKKRPEVNYESSSQERAIKWNAAGMRLCEHTADGEEIICDLINGTSDITGKVQSNSNIDTLIDNERLCDEVCAYLGIKKDETVKCEKEGDITKIIPTSGLHKGKEFSIIAGNPPMFKNKDGHQLMTIAPEHMNHHLFKDHFCWGWQEVDGGKDCYEFCKHTGGQEVAYHAIKEVQTGSIKFAAGRPEKSEIESDKEIKFLNIGEIPGLSHLSKSGLSLDAIFNQQDETIELTALQHHGEPIKLKQEGGKWVLASNPNMQLITHAQFTDLLQGERQDGLGGTSTAGIENPMGYLGESRYLVFKESTTSLTSRNLLFLIPEEVKDEEEAKNLFDDKGEGKVNKDSPYGIFGRAEPSKPYFNEATLAVQSHFLRWSMDKVGRYSEFAIQESDNKAIAHTAITLIARAMREKNYAQALGFLNAIPKGLQLGKGAEDDTIRRMFFDIIRDDFDNTPEVATMHMQLFLKWFQMDTKVTESVWRFIADYNKSLPAGTQQISEEIFSKLIRDKFVRACRDEAFYSQSLALTSLQKQALLEKLPDDVFIKCDKYHWAVAKVLNEANRWREGQKEIVSAIIAKPVDMEPVSVVTRNKASEANVSDGERSAFSALRKHFAQLDPRPTQTKGDTLLDGEEQSSPFTFLGTEQRGESEGAILKGEFDRYDQEIDEGRKKALEETGFIPENAKLADTTRTDSVQKALEECDSELTQQKNDALEKLQELYKGIFSTHISAGEISRDNMMPVLVELMLNRGKPAVEAGEGSVTLDFPAQKMQVKMSRAQYKEFLETTRSYLLTTSILKKNELIKARLEELQGLQAKLTDNPVDGSLIAQTRAAYLALNREIAAQKELCGPDEPDKDFYGEVAEVVGGGITRDELMVYEVLSGIRPYVKQAELLKNLFEGKTKAFQLIMGGGKTAVLLSLFCFYISRQESMSVPVILSHASQFESVVGNVGEYQRSRFNQDIMLLDVSREQLKDVDQLKKILENLQTAKAKHQVIVAKTSLLNVLQLTFQELCNPSDRIKELQSQIGALSAQLKLVEQAKTDAQDDQIVRLENQQDVLGKKIDKLKEELEGLQGQKGEEKFELLRDILRFFKEETTGIFDEADMNLNVMEEVNFPSGHEKPMSNTQR
ncbi:MAG: hypothetical protein LBQ23_01475, partial [Puniceicoccales bacterium]|nr:hypothetical protein [Puniceicoccales bacterium]